MQSIIKLSFMLFLLAFSFSDADELTNIEVQRVITSQLTAFLNEDAEGAWLHAHPSIKAQFTTPERFMTMVEAGYEPMTRFVQLDFLSQEKRDDIWLQTVRMLDDRGDRYELLYLLVENEAGVFQITGVSLEVNNGI